MTDITKKIERHNRKVRHALKRAERGEVINLTELLISRAKLEDEIEECERLAGEG
jgi:hypothetical protein